MILTNFAIKFYPVYYVFEHLGLLRPIEKYMEENFFEKGEKFYQKMMD